MLPADLLFALAVFAFVALITPGPNNIMLMASGVNFGLRRSLPHLFGIFLGFLVMIVLVGLGIGGLFTALPWLHTALKIASVLYLLWLAWRLGRATDIGEGSEGAQPMTFLQAAAFQWVNPKGWAMALSATAAYTVPDDFTLSILIVGGVFSLLGLPCLFVWALFGVSLRKVLSNRRNLRLFNIAMALLLAASVIPVLAGHKRPVPGLCGHTKTPEMPQFFKVLLTARERQRHTFTRRGLGERDDRLPDLHFRSAWRRRGSR